MVSAYFQFREPTADYVARLESILDSLEGDVVIGADVNARSRTWHDVKTDKRGRIVEEMVHSRGLNVENRSGQPPTFKNRGSANLDITLTSRGLSGKITEWTVFPGITTSDHAVILFNLSTFRAHYDSGPIKPKRFVSRGVDWEGFRKSLRAGLKDVTMSGATADVGAGLVTRVLDSACHSNMRVRGPTQRKNPVWWNPELGRKINAIRDVRNRIRKTRDRLRNHEDEGETVGLSVQMGEVWQH